MTDRVDVRGDYDRVARAYADHLADELRHKPLDRALLDRFAARTRGRGRVCDLGCGPGHVAGHLRAAGADVSGVDLSPGMLAEARRLNPGLAFHESDLLALDIPSSSLAGIAAFYAIVNLPPEALPLACAEMARVLQPGGLLLLSFHVGGDEVLRPPELWGVAVALEFFMFTTARVRTALEAADLVVEDVIERDPYPEVEFPSRRAYVFARKD